MTALLLASFLHAPAGLIATVYDMGGIDAVAVVTFESQWNVRAWRVEVRGHTSFGLFQLDDEWHPQYRDDVLLHIATGVEFLGECKSVSGGSLARAFSIYNSGTSWRSIAKGREVEKLRAAMEWWLFIHLR